MLSDKLKKIAEQIKNGMAGRYAYRYDSLGNSLFFTLPAKSSGANLLIVREGKKYHIMALKKNKLEGFRFHMLYGAMQPTLETLRYKKVIAQSDKIIKYYKENVKETDLVKLLLVKESLPSALFEQWFPELQQQVDNEGWKVDNFNIIIDDKTKEDDKKNIESAILEASKLIKSTGLGKLLYGKIIIVPKLPGRTIADYCQNDDTIRILRKLKKDKKMISGFIHELGHRLYDKGMVNKQDIGKKYSDVMIANIKNQPKVEKGDVFIGQNGNELKIEDREYTGRSVKILFTMNNKKYQASEGYFYNLEKIKGDTSIQPDKTWIPTAYSQTNQKEWFSEIFATALVNNIKELKDFIKQVSK